MLPILGSSCSITVSPSNGWPPWLAPPACRLSSCLLPSPARHLIRPQAQQEDLGTQQSNDQQIGISRASRGRSQQVVQLVEEPILGEQEEQQGAQQHLVVLADQLGQSPLQPSHHVVVSNSIPLQAPIDSSISSVSQVPVQGTSQLEHPLPGTVFGDLSLQPLGRSRRSLSPFAVAALRLRLTPQRFLTTLAFLFAVILVNFGIETALDHYLGDSVAGSLLCIFVGAGTLTYLRLKQFKVAKVLLRGFWS